MKIGSPRVVRIPTVIAVVLMAATFVCDARTRADAAPVPPWTTNGPAGEDILSLAIDPVTPSTVYAGGELGRIFKSTHGGTDWTLLDTGLLTGAHAFIITADASAMYVGTDNGVFVSTDAGDTWTAAGLEATVVNALVIDPNSPATIYAGAGGGGGEQGVYRGTVGGTEWERTDNGMPDTIVRALATDPLEEEHIFPTVLFAATDDGLFRSVDQGVTWHDATAGLPDAAVNVVATHPINLFTLYAGTDAGVFTSTDIGETWHAAGESFTSAVSSLAIDPSSGDLYAGTFGDGVFVSTNGGTNWSDYNDGLTNGIVHALALAGGPPLTLYAGTIGDGVFLTRSTDGQCLGDCDGNGAVTVNEIIVMVNIDLGSLPVTGCPAADPDNTGTVSITQIIAAVSNALNGCP